MTANNIVEEVDELRDETKDSVEESMKKLKKMSMKSKTEMNENAKESSIEPKDSLQEDLEAAIEENSEEELIWIYFKNDGQNLWSNCTMEKQGWVWRKLVWKEEKEMSKQRKKEG